jgi:hypothetical protein
MRIGRTRVARRAACLVGCVAAMALALVLSAAQVPPFNEWRATQNLDSPSAPFTPPGPYETCYIYDPFFHQWVETGPVARR